MKIPHIARSIAVHATAVAGTVAMTFGCSAEPGEVHEGQRAYPRSANYGYVSGDVPPPSLAWRGIGEDGSQGVVSITDYYDRDGSRGINALLVDQSTAWCGVCQRLAAKLGENVHGVFREHGIHVLTLITQNGDASPATPDTAHAWQKHFGLDGSAVVADPSRSFRGTAGEDLAPYPYEVIIDPRTMEILSVDAGYDGRGDFSALLDLARANAR